jgi:hypothetical protein
MIRYYGLYANAYRGKVKKAGTPALRVIREKLGPVPSKSWAAMIRKVYEVDPMKCPKCGNWMKIFAFLTQYSVVDRIIDHLKLSFVAEKPPPHLSSPCSGHRKAAPDGRRGLFLVSRPTHPF